MLSFVLVAVGNVMASYSSFQKFTKVNATRADPLKVDVGESPLKKSLRHRYAARLRRIELPAQNHAFAKFTRLPQTLHRAHIFAALRSLYQFLQLLIKQILHQ